MKNNQSAYFEETSVNSNTNPYLNVNGSNLKRKFVN
jgi:hypothetical protein